MSDDARQQIGVPFDWDGMSPINGEPVERVIEFATHRLAYTASAMYEVFRKGTEPFVVLDFGSMPAREYHGDPLQPWSQADSDAYRRGDKMMLPTKSK